jgi:hypothetical protein
LARRAEKVLDDGVADLIVARAADAVDELVDDGRGGGTL